MKVGQFVLHRGISLGDRFQLVVKIHDHFVERQPVLDNHLRIGDVFHLDLRAPALFAKLEERADIFRRRVQTELHVRLFHVLHDLGERGKMRRIFQFHLIAVGGVDFVHNRRSRCNQIEVELALQPLLHNLHVEQSQKSAAKTKSESRRSLGLIAQTRVIENELLESLLEILKILRFDRENAGKHHRLDFLKPRQRLFAGFFALVTVSPTFTSRMSFIPQITKPTSPASSCSKILRKWREDSELKNLVLFVRRHELDRVAGLEHAIDNPAKCHHALIGVEPRIKNERTQSGASIRFRRRALF